MQRLFTLTFERIRGLFRRFFPRRGAAPVELVPSSDDVVLESRPEPIAAARPDKPASLSGYEEVDSTRWHFKGAILDRLDEYFKSMDILKRRDPDAYKLFARLGLSIPADVYANPDSDKYATFPEKRPSFGGFLMPLPDDAKDRWCYGVFYYFRKVQKPSRVQSFVGDVYDMSFILDNRHGFGVIADCHIGVSADGSMTLLKEPVVENRVVRAGTRRKKSRRHTLELRTIRWHYPKWIYSLKPDDKNPEEWICGLLREAAWTYLSAVEKIVVRVTKSKSVAAFGIDVARAKYFFADRETDALAADGKRKRIFHAVKEHTRQLSASRQTSVKSHYRGLRAFGWNNYWIHIVLPKFSDVMECPIPGVYTEDIATEERKRFIREAEVAEKLEELLTA